MVLTNAIQAYPDCHEFLEAVVDDPQGGRIWKGTKAQAEKFRHRCHQFRRLDRKQSERIYERGDRRHGTSAYDPLKLTLREDWNGEWWVYAEQQLNAPHSIELLSEVEPDPVIIEGNYEVIRHVDRLMIEDHSHDDEETQH